MTHLANKVISCGLCNNCGEQTVTAISEHEAKQIIEVCKAEFVAVIKKKLFKYPNCENSRIRNDIMREAIKAIESVE